MAENIDNNIVDLTSLTLRKARLEIEKQYVETDTKAYKKIEEKIKSLENEIKLKAKDIELVNKSRIALEKENAAKSASLKIYADHEKLIKQSNASLAKQWASLDKIQKSTGIRNYDTTIGSLFKTLKSGNIKDTLFAFKSAGKVSGTLANTFKALGGTAGIAVTSIGLLAKGAQIAYDNLVAPSARMYNVAGQQLGISAANRNLFGGQFLKEWANRFSLGYSAEEQQGLFSTLVGAIRLNPEKNIALYENSLQGLMAAQRIWGVDNATLGTISKAYLQVGVSGERLGSKFDMLMRSVDGTGWTTSEYSTVLAKNVMYLKNFGVNIDTFAQELKGYGNLVRQEKLTLQDVSTGGWQRENTGNLAFMAQEFLRSGIISEQELGAGLGDTVFAQAGALKEYLGKKIKAGEISEIVRLFESNPMFRGLMESSGALGSKYAFKELLSTAGLPLSSEIASVFEGKSATDAWNIAHGRLGATSSGEFIEEKSLKELSDEARKNYAATSSSLKRLLLEIADLIRKEADNMGAGNPLDLSIK